MGVTERMVVEAAGCGVAEARGGVAVALGDAASALAVGVALSATPGVGVCVCNVGSSGPPVPGALGAGEPPGIGSVAGLALFDTLFDAVPVEPLTDVLAPAPAALATGAGAATLFAVPSPPAGGMTGIVNRTGAGVAAIGPIDVPGVPVNGSDDDD